MRWFICWEWSASELSERQCRSAYPTYATAAPMKSVPAQKRLFSAVFSPPQGPVHFPAIAGGFGR